MAEFITAIRTVDGDMQIDYEYLANKPVADVYEFESRMAAKQDASTAITQSNIISYLSDKTVANAENASQLGGKDASKYALAADYLKINKDTRPLILSEGVHYGTEEQMNSIRAVAGQIFFKKIEEVEV